MPEKTESSQEPKKLYRSGTNRMIGGVCAGFAEYFNIDVTLVRIIWVIFALFKGLGAIVYLACLIFMPENPEERAPSEEDKKPPQNTGLIIGIILIVIGLVFLARVNYYWFSDWPFYHFWFFPFGNYWPVLLILFGVLYIVHVLRKEKQDRESGDAQVEKTVPKKLTRSISDKMISGVCSGLAKYWQVDVALIRVGWAIATIYTGFWLGILAYIVMIFAVPEEELVQSSDPKPASKRTTTRTKTVAKKTSKKNENSK